MHEKLFGLGRLLGGIGVLICVLAVVARLARSYTIGGFEVGTLFLGGIAAMVAGCYCLLLRLASRP
jgi:hypothetical protein